jgi:hypothetical protein
MDSRVLAPSPVVRRKALVWCFILLALLSLLVSGSAFAQPSGMCDGCTGMMGSGMGAIMWLGMIIAWLVGIAAIAALVALAVYLVRRSKL